MRGRLVDAGRGVALGYPGLAGYRRVVTPVRTADGEPHAWIYVIAGPSAPDSR